MAIKLSRDNIINIIIAFCGLLTNGIITYVNIESNANTNRLNGLYKKAEISVYLGDHLTLDETKNYNLVLGINPEMVKNLSLFDLPFLFTNTGDKTATDISISFMFHNIDINRYSDTIAEDLDRMKLNFTQKEAVSICNASLDHLNPYQKIPISQQVYYRSPISIYGTMDSNFRKIRAQQTSGAEPEFSINVNFKDGTPQTFWCSILTVPSEDITTEAKNQYQSLEGLIQMSQFVNLPIDSQTNYLDHVRYILLSPTLKGVVTKGADTSYYYTCCSEKNIKFSYFDRSLGQPIILNDDGSLFLSAYDSIPEILRNKKFSVPEFSK